MLRSIEDAEADLLRLQRVAKTAGADGVVRTVGVLSGEVTFREAPPYSAQDY